MKETIKTSRTAGYLEKIYRVCNEHYFSGRLEEPTITIQPTPRAYGHVSVSKIWKAKGERKYELNIGAGTLDRHIEDVVATMLHEMVHIYHLMNGIKDTSRGYSYHNKTFKERAEKCDLRIEYDKGIGWSLTYPTDKLIDFILEQGWSEIMINRGGFYKKPDNDKGGNSNGNITILPPIPPDNKKKVWKYQCNKCKMSVRATRDLTGKLKCTECDNIMIEV